LDELDAALGFARCESLPPTAAELLLHVQLRMVDLRARLMTPNKPAGGGAAKQATELDAETALLEQAIDRFQSGLKPLDTFIIPGGSRAAAALHLARAVCRRAERRLVALRRAEPVAVAPPMMAYVNRLSDLLFVLARAANAAAGVADELC
jgi:cob(I)alamin adenosyltransferase